MIFKWNRTILLEDRLNDKIVDGMYEGRPVIKRDTSIDGGVYLGAYQREAIVVDSSKENGILDQCYSAVLNAVVDPEDNKVDRSKILRTTFETTKRLLKPDERKVDAIIDHLQCGDDDKIDLGVFVAKGYGVCRHQALLAGFILERFIKEGFIGGKVSMERNSCVFGAHAWIRYTNSQGVVYILDPRRDFLGRLDEAKDWDYKRENE